MEKTRQQLALEVEYGRDIFALVREKYEDDGLTQHELADELGVPRSSLQLWLREAGVDIRRRTLSPVQRIAICVLLPYLSNRRIAERVGCAPVTVARYRRELHRHPIDDLPRGTVSLDCELTERDRRLLDPTTASQWVPPSTDVTPETDTHGVTTATAEATATDGGAPAPDDGTGTTDTAERPSDLAARGTTAQSSLADY